MLQVERNAQTEIGGGGGCREKQRRKNKKRSLASATRKKGIDVVQEVRAAAQSQPLLLTLMSHAPV